MNARYLVRFFGLAGFFQFGFLDGLPVRLRWLYLREARVGLGSWPRRWYP